MINKIKKCNFVKLNKVERKYGKDGEIEKILVKSREFKIALLMVLLSVLWVLDTELITIKYNDITFIRNAVGTIVVVMLYLSIDKCLGLLVELYKTKYESKGLSILTPN